MAKRTATLTPKQPSKSAKRAKSALRTEPLSSEALFTLGGDDATHALVEAEVLRRPSQRNRSPYVADATTRGGPRAICHVPSLDLGGKCVAGSTILVKPALDTKGNLVGPDAVNPKYGTPNASSTASSPSSREAATSGPTHLSAKAAVAALATTVAGIGTCLDRRPREGGDPPRGSPGPRGQDMRADFVISGGSEKDRVLEVKTVVDASVDSGVDADEESGPTAALFPWGSKNQKGPDGEKVVSARAIKHVDALAAIAKEKASPAAVLFVVARGDCSPSGPTRALPVVRRAPEGRQESRRDPRRAEGPLRAGHGRLRRRRDPRRSTDGAIPVDVRNCALPQRRSAARMVEVHEAPAAERRVRGGRAPPPDPRLLVRVVVQPRCCNLT